MALDKNYYLYSTRRDTLDSEDDSALISRYDFAFVKSIKRFAWLLIFASDAHATVSVETPVPSRGLSRSLGPSASAMAARAHARLPFYPIRPAP